MIWYVRWQITRALVWLAFAIAPRSATRTLFVDALEGASQQIIDTVARHKKEES